MSLQTQSRRLIQTANALTRSSPISFLEPCRQRRTFFWRKQKEQAAQGPANPFLDNDLVKKPQAVDRPKRGELADSSIFEDEALAGPKPATTADKTGSQLPPRNPATMAMALDPKPIRRRRWERKMVIREITKRGRLTNAQQLKRQERVAIVRSHDFKSSVKKMVHLAQQITGKTVEDAITQMRFSKKKVAKDIKEHLEYARNKAIVARGMGLGNGEAEFTPMQIKTNSGKRITVKNPSTLYVSQAWLGKGDFGVTPDYRARGQVHMMKNRSTSITVELKEEATRIRQHNEREEKIRKRKVWVQLPNRPVTTQRQHYSW